MPECIECDKEYEEFQENEVDYFIYNTCKECCIKSGIKHKKNMELIKTESDDRILKLIRMCHPTEKGEIYSRYDVMEEIERRGFDLLKGLNWTINLDSIYKNRYTGSLATLKDQLLKVKTELGQETEYIDLGQLFGVLEHYYPIGIWNDSDMFEEYKNKTTQERLF